MAKKLAEYLVERKKNTYLCRNKNRMNKTIKRILKICGGVVAVVIILLVAAIVTSSHWDRF